MAYTDVLYEVKNQIDLHRFRVLELGLLYDNHN